MVRSLLNGRFANTSFCIFDPQGQNRLTRAGRGPSHMAGRPGTPGTGDEDVIRQMDRIAARFTPKESKTSVVLQDFETFRQALNVASADQRLLLWVTSEKEEAKTNLGTALSDKEIVGRFHVDFLDPNAKADKNWKKAIAGESKKPGFLIIQSGQFGLKGDVVKELSEDSTADQIAAALKESNAAFASTEKRKKYSQHVAEGRRKGVYFENEIPYGEDRDGDGKSDQKKRGRRGLGRR